MTGVQVGEQLLIEMTDAYTGDAHLVTDDAVRAGRHTGRLMQNSETSSAITSLTCEDANS
ncbi:MAG: hypothetical protein ACRDTE_00550 [Pseudonocardiaceae bacterium]